jgi:hypothetical protein
MSNYINQNNQHLLWKSVHQISAFAKLDPARKEYEFKNVIEYFYRKVSSRGTLSIPELQQLNRETISAFLPSPKTVASPPITVASPPITTSSMSLSPIPMVESRQPVVESRQEKSQREFQERQNMYERMNAKPDIPSADIFLEKNADDGVIQNMDELILRLQKERELDYKTIPPPVEPPKKLKVLEETPLSDKDVKDIDSYKKTVSWSENLISVQESPKYDIPEEWQERILKMEKRIDFLENALREQERNSKKKTAILKENMAAKDVNLVRETINDMIFRIERNNKLKNRIQI